MIVMPEKKNYHVKLLFVENPDFSVRPDAKYFIVQDYCLDDAISSVDRILYNKHVTGQEDDFFNDSYNWDSIRCEVTFGDAEAGLQLRYEIKES